MFRLSHLFDPAFKAARQRAIEHVRRTHPDYAVGSASLRADERDRHVFAVFYSDDDGMTCPGPYLLLAVPKDGGDVEEVPRTPGSPYRVRGLK